MSLDFLETEWWSLQRMTQGLREGRLSPEQLLKHYLERIERFNPVLRAFVSFHDPSVGRREGREARAHGLSGPIAGIPFGVKDVSDCRGFRTTHGSTAHADGPIAGNDSEEVSYLRALGAIPVGKTNTPEFAGGIVTTSPVAGETLNPYDTALSPGGSSGGSAAAVAAGLVPFATGTDGGGSIRIPASYCGLVGLKPSNGLLSSAVARSDVADLSCIGVLTRTVADTELLVNLMVHERWRKSGWSIAPIRHDRVPQGVRLAWWSGSKNTPVDPEVLECCRDAFDRLCHESQARAVAIPDAIPEDPNEVLEALACIDWLKHLYPDTGPDLTLDKLTHYFRRRLEQCQGRTVDEFARALQRRHRLQAVVATVLTRVDILVSPTTATPAIATAERMIRKARSGETVDDMAPAPFTRLANLCKLPAISVCAGYTSKGMPIGIQLMGRHGEDRILLGLASQIERTVTRRPNDFSDGAVI